MGAVVVRYYHKQNIRSRPGGRQTARMGGTLFREETLDVRE